MRWSHHLLPLVLGIGAHAYSLPLKKTRLAARQDAPKVPDDPLFGTADVPSGSFLGSQATVEKAPQVSAVKGALVTGKTQDKPAAVAKNGAQGLKNAQDWVYTIEVHFGKDKQAVPMLIDTGSFTFWAAGTQCPTCAKSGMTTALPVDPAHCTKYETEYGAGKLSGCLINSSLSFGPFELDGIAMAAATEIGDKLMVHGESFSGMFGLAMPFRPETTTPISYMLDKGIVDSPWVGFRLFREGEGDSELIFGDALTSKYATTTAGKKHAEVKQVENGGPSYNISLDSVLIHGQKVEDAKMEKQAVLLDTGTSNIVVPDSKHRAIMEALSTKAGEGIYTNPATKEAVFPCDAFKPDEPVWGFVFGGQQFNVPWKDIIGRPIPNKALVDPKDVKSAFKNLPPDAPSKYCESRVQRTGEEIWILGDAFLVNVYHAINCLTGSVQLWSLD